MKMTGNRQQQQNMSISTRYNVVGNSSGISKPSFNRDSADAIQLQVGKEYQVDTYLYNGVDCSVLAVALD